MPSVNIQGVGVVRFPDDMPVDQIHAAIERDILPSYAPKPSLTDKVGDAASAVGDVVGGALDSPAGQTVENIGRVYPVAEAAANLASQAYAVPAGGIAGLGAMATHALGMDEAAAAGNPIAKALTPNPADAVANVSDALTVKPMTEHGAEMTATAVYPFQKLAEAGNYVGEHVAEATGSPTAGAVANAATQLAVPGFLAKGVHVIGDRLATRPEAPPIENVSGTAHEEAVNQSLQQIMAGDDQSEAPPVAVTDANSSAVRGYAQEITPEKIDAAPVPSNPPLVDAADELRGQMREPPPANNIDVSESDAPIENIDAAPPPVEQPIHAEPPATNVDVKEQPIENIDAAPPPDVAPNLPERTASNISVDELPVETDEDRANESVAAARDMRLPQGLKDPRLLRGFYRNHLQGMANELQAGRVAYKQDENGTITGRLPSTNPQWFQGAGITVAQTQHAVKKALAGRPLGAREAKMVGGMLDVIHGRRTADDMMAFARENRAQARQQRRQAAMGLPPLHAYADHLNRHVGELYEDSAYHPDWDGHTSSLYELMHEAHAVNPAQTERIADSARPDTDVARELLRIIHESQQPNRPQESAGRQEAGLRAAETPSLSRDQHAAGISGQPDRSVTDGAGQLEHGVNPLTQAPLPESADHLSAQVDAFLAGKKRGVLISGHDQADSRSKTRLNVAVRKREAVSRVVPQGTLYANPDNRLLVPLAKALAAGNADAVRSLVGQITLNISPDVAAAHPADMDRIVQARDENGGIVSQVGATADTEKAAAKQIKDQGASVETVPIDKGLQDRQAPIESYTEADLADREKQKTDAAVARAKDDAKTEADNERDSFTLTGSDRTADTAAAAGQQDLLADHNSNGPKTAETIMPVDAAAHEAATSPHNDLPAPTEGQIEAGNYKKGHVRIGGIDISIENPAGSARTGIDPNGKPWSVTMKSHYGYIKGSVGADKDHVDVFVKPGTPEDYNGPVFVVDQKKPGNGHFDEHKLLMGWKTEDGAKLGYRQNYTPNWKVGPITKMTVPELKAWLKSGDTTKPAAHTHHAEHPGSTSEKGAQPENSEKAITARPLEELAADAFDVDPEATRAILASGADDTTTARRLQEIADNERKVDGDPAQAGRAGGEPQGSRGRVSQSGREDDLRSVSRGTDLEGRAAPDLLRKGTRSVTFYRGSRSELAPQHFRDEALGKASGHPTSGLGVWFTDSKKEAARYGSHVGEYNLRVGNPKVFKVEDLPAFDTVADATAYREKLRSEGYDGIVVHAEHLGGQTHVVAFDHDQVVRPTADTEEARAEAPTEEAKQAPADDQSSEGGQENAGTANMTPGATYHGFISSTAPRVPQAPPMPGLLGKLFPSRPRVAKPIRREDIIRPFLKALNTRLYEGRVKGKGVMGFYRHPKGEVRVKRKADLETTAHEIAHLIDDRVFNGFRTDKTRAITRPWTSGPSHQVYATELKGLSLDKNKVHEGFAEFVRHWMTSPDIARKEAPQFTAWWENFVDTNKIGPALRDTQRGMAAWFDQDNATKLASKIGEPPPVNADLDTIFDEARQSVFDDLHGVYRMERDLKGDILPGGAYETARLTRGAHSVVEGAMTIGAPEAQADGSVRFVGKSLRAILDPVANDLDNFGVYAVARSARELMAQGRENLFTAGEIKAGLALETPEFRKAFSDYQDWNKKIVDFAEAKGLINPQTRKLWRRTEYLPFYRSGQRGATKNAGGMLGHSNPIKQLRGGTANLKSVLGNMIHNASTLITESLKNEARDEIAKLADTVAGGGKFMVRIGTDTKSMSVSKEQVRDFVAEMLGVKRDELRGSGGLSTVPPDLQVAVDKLTNEFMQQPDYLKFWMFKQAPKGDNLVAVMRDGKPQFYEVADPVLYRSMQALTRPARHWLVQFLNTFRMVGQTAVTLTPDFVLKNIARDTIMGGIMSRSGFRPIVDSLIGMKSRIKKDENYREYIANGGGFSSLLAQEDAFAKHLEKFYSKRGISYKTVLDSPTKLLHFIEEAANAFESSTRLGEYKRAREGGADPRHAAFAAREVSTDFAMRGDSHVAGFFYDTVPFLKAAANSMDRLYRGLAHDENRAHIAAKAGLLALASMALYNINRGNPLYEQLEDWDRDSNWHFFLPKSGVPDNAAPAERYTHYRFPKLWEIGAVSSLAERSLQHIMDQNAKGFGDEAGKIVSNVFGVDYVPQLLSPLYENELNKNRFTGRPIETQGMEELQPWARVGPYTSRSLAALGEKTRNLPEALQVNPVRTEALLRGYLKTWAQYGLSLVDGALFDDKPDMRADEYPVLRSFYEQEPAKHTKYETQFYDALKEATQLRRTMRHMNQTDRPEIADDLSAKDDGSYGILHGTQRSLEGITRDMREVYRSKTMLPKQKRKELDALIGERNSLLKDTMSDVKDAQGQAAVQ